VIEGTSTGSTTGSTTTTSTDETSSTSGATSSDATSSTTSDASSETSVPSCSEWTTEEECDAAFGCSVEKGEAFAWDDATGVCASLGPTFVCHDANGVVTAPGSYWRAVGDVVEVVQLNNSPFQLEGWDPCGCRPGDPLACFGCADVPGCVTPNNCNESTDAESCAAHHPSEYCAWVEVTTLDGDGTGCKEIATEGRCIVAFPDKASCELVQMPRACAAWTDASPPYVRSIGGAMELVRGTSCDALPAGYMPCWSSPVEDPAACECGC
jgi:hypothetical protein